MEIKIIRSKEKRTLAYISEPCDVTYIKVYIGNVFLGKYQEHDTQNVANMVKALLDGKKSM